MIYLVRPVLRLIGTGCLLAAVAAPAWPGWDHGPLSDTTRLPAGQSRVWEWSMLYNQDGFYPAEFSCPAGFDIRLHVLNLTQESLVIEWPEPSGQVVIRPHSIRTLARKRIEAGEHEFLIHQPLDDDRPHGHHAEDEIPGLIRCRILADTWPERDAIVRSAWILQGGRLMPGVLRVPAGLFNEIFTAAAPGTSTVTLSAGEKELVFATGQVRMTEWPAPKSSTLNISETQPPGRLEFH